MRYSLAPLLVNFLPSVIATFATFLTNVFEFYSVKVSLPTVKGVPGPGRNAFGAL